MDFFHEILIVSFSLQRSLFEFLCESLATLAQEACVTQGNFDRSSDKPCETLLLLSHGKPIQHYVGLSAEFLTLSDVLWDPLDLTADLIT